MPKKFALKVILLGDSGVGKTSIRRSYMGDSFKQNYNATIGTDLSVKRIGNSFLSIFDLAGQLGYKFIREEYYAGAQGLILVYDLTRKNTANQLDIWFQEIEKNVYPAVPIILVANKSDLERKHNFDASDLIKKIYKWSGIKVHTIETSALTGANIEQMFDLLLKQMEDNISKYENQSKSSLSV